MKKLFLQYNNGDLQLFLSDKLHSLWQGKGYDFQIEQYRVDKDHNDQWRYPYILFHFNVLAWRISKENNEKII